jgi:hypothetical protein
MTGKQIRVFFVDGTPGGLTTVEIINWTGHIIASQRSDLKQLLAREEARRTGVYLLVGDDPESPGSDLVYVGEGDDVSKRLYAHSTDAKKDFFQRVVVITNKDATLTKAHVRYLESRLIDVAKSVGRVRLDNGTSPPPTSLPEADVSDMEYFIEQIRLVLPVLGLNMLRSVRTAPVGAPSAASVGEVSPVFTLTVKGTDARAQEVDGEFVVRQGSLGRLKWDNADQPNYRKLREKLEADGVLVPTETGDQVTFTRDHVFASPSAAAASVLGRNSNGRLEWKVEGTATTYAQWQESLLSPIPDAGDAQGDD